jgi:hypothetical protein
MVGVSLDGEPDEVSAAMAAASAPRKLSDVRLTRDDAAAELIAYLLVRWGNASVEKEEIAAFTQANRSTLDRETLSQVDSVIARAGSADSDFAVFAGSVVEAIRMYLSGRGDDVELPSDRLLWLCLALASQVAREALTHQEARQYLERPHNRRRIDRMSLGYMINDAIESEGEAPAFAKFATEYAMLIAEGSLLLDDPGFVYAAFTLLRHLPPPADPPAWVEVVGRCARRLAAADMVGADESAFIQRVATRFGARRADDDL